MGQSLSQAIDNTKENDTEKSKLMRVERGMQEKLGCVKAKLYIGALNDECIPIVCAVDKFSDMIWITDTKNVDPKNEVESIIRRHLHMGKGEDDELIKLVTDVLKTLLSREKGSSYKEEFTHVVYANKSFIRFDYHVHVEILDEEKAALFYYGQVGLMEVGKARPPVLIYELRRSTKDEHLESVGGALEQLSKLKSSTVEEAAKFLKGGSVGVTLP